MQETVTSAPSDGLVPHFIRIARNVDTLALLAELDASPQMWSVDTSRQRKVRCQRNTRNIFLRAPRKPLPPGKKNANDVHDSRIAPAARKFPRTLAYCGSVAEELGGTLGRANLVALLPHSRVFPHVDSGAYYRIRDRFHLVLRSPGGSPLTSGDQTVVMRPGELWALNNKARHSADNPSEVPRIHLIFDVLPPQGHGFFVFPVNDTHRTQLCAHGDGQESSHSFVFASNEANRMERHPPGGGQGSSNSTVRVGPSLLV